MLNENTFADYFAKLSARWQRGALETPRRLGWWVEYGGNHGCGLREQREMLSLCSCFTQKMGRFAEDFALIVSIQFSSQKLEV